MKKMFWEYFCSLDLSCFPALIKEFYNTLAYGENGLYAVVKRVTIKITKEILGSVLYMSTSGIVDTSLEDKEDTVRMIIDDNARYTNGELLTNQLNAEMR